MIPTNAGHYYYVKGSDTQGRDYGRRLDKDDATIAVLLGMGANTTPDAVKAYIVAHFSISDARTVDLKTVYPGLIIGSGNLHPVPEAVSGGTATGDFQNGFTFDWTTGLPYIPGSTVKGVLRSVFPKTNDSDDIRNSKKAYVTAAMREIMDAEELPNGFVDALEVSLFEGKDVYHDAFICSFPQNSGKIFAEDYITPHHSPLLDPTPLRILKIAPNIGFRFQFVPRDAVIKSVNVRADHKVAFYRQVLMEFGIGAKRNFYGELEMP